MGRTEEKTTTTTTTNKIRERVSVGRGGGVERNSRNSVYSHCYTNLTTKRTTTTTTKT